MTDSNRRSWDAGSYHTVSTPMVEMAMRVLERLPLEGDEHVLDAGCGSGRVTAFLAERLPDGHVLALDADADMVRVATETLAPLGERVTVRLADLLELDLDAAVDAVFSTATFHWVLDHERLFANLHRALRPGGRLVAQCGGAGNVAAVFDAANDAAADARWAAHFEGWTRPHLYATAEETEARLRAAGFTDVRCWLAPNPVVPDDPREFLSTIVLGAHVQRVPEGDERDAYVDAVLARLDEPITLHYVRLNIDAARA